MAAGVCRFLSRFQRSSRLGTSGSVRTMAVLPWLFSSKPRDLSLPNSSWSSETMRLYKYYNSQCEVEAETGARQSGRWKRLPSYNCYLKDVTGGVYLRKTKARLFTRNIRTPGAGFEYAVFVNKEEPSCVCIFQPGYLLEGPPGCVHGGAIATIIDAVTGLHATYLAGSVMTANLNVNYHSPISLGSTVLLESYLHKKDGRKMSLSCKITSSDGSNVHTEATALFVSIAVSQLKGV